MSQPQDDNSTGSGYNDRKKPDKNAASGRMDHFRYWLSSIQAANTAENAENADNLLTAIADSFNLRISNWAASHRSSSDKTASEKMSPDPTASPYTSFESLLTDEADSVPKLVILEAFSYIKSKVSQDHTDLQRVAELLSLIHPLRSNLAQSLAEKIGIGSLTAGKVNHTLEDPFESESSGKLRDLPSVQVDGDFTIPTGICSYTLHGLFTHLRKSFKSPDSSTPDALDNFYISCVQYAFLDVSTNANTLVVQFDHNTLANDTEFLEIRDSQLALESVDVYPFLKHSGEATASCFETSQAEAVKTFTNQLTFQGEEGLNRLKGLYSSLKKYLSLNTTESNAEGTEAIPQGTGAVVE